MQDAMSSLKIVEAHFYFRIRVNAQEFTLAFVSCYSFPDPDLLKASQGTLWSCTRGESVQVVDVKHIAAVVAMVPHEPFPGVERFFLVEKPGLDVNTIGGKEEETMDID